MELHRCPLARLDCLLCFAELCFLCRVSELASFVFIFLRSNRSLDFRSAAIAQRSGKMGSDLSLGPLESRKVLSHSPWGELANSSYVCNLVPWDRLPALLPCDSTNSAPERPGRSLGTPSYTEMLGQACDHRVTLYRIGITSDARFPGCRGVKATAVFPLAG